MKETLFRCTRCNAYANPFFKFIDGGNTAICNICQKPNKIPNEYYSPINHSGDRSDKYQRAELHKGVYDLQAPSNYPRKKIPSNLIIMCLEMTPASIQSGVFAQALCSLQMALQSLPNPARTEVSICTYGSQLNFYSIPKDLSNDPQLIVVADLEDPFCPFPKNALFLRVIEDREKIDYLVEKLQKSSDTVLQEAESTKQYSIRTASIGAVVQSIASMLEDSPARIIAFTSQLPSIGLGKLKRRDDVKILGTEQEKTLYVPQCKSYNEISRSLLKNSISVDLFVFCPDYCDLATISQLCTETGGNLHYYPHYSAQDAEKIHYELYRSLTRASYTDCLMTIRTSPGIILEDYYTSKGKVSVRDLPISCMNADSVIVISYKQDEKITAAEAYLQYACLYTDSDGSNKIRVINLALPVQNTFQNIFKFTDLDAIFALLVRKTLINITSQTLQQISDALTAQIVTIFYSYRVHCSISSSPSQLLLPESIKYLIVYHLALLKSDFFKKQQAKPDARVYDMIRLFSLPMHQLSNLLYPKIYPIHTIMDTVNDIDGNPFEAASQAGTYISDDRVSMPSTIPCSLDRLSSFGVYLIDNSETIFAYVQKDVNPELLEQLFGVQDYEQLREITQFPALTDNDFANSVNAVIDQIRRNRNGAYQNIRIVLYKDPYEQTLKSLFIEDEMRGVMTYSNYIVEVHKKIQAKCTS